MSPRLSLEKYARDCSVIVAVGDVQQFGFRANLILRRLPTSRKFIMRNAEVVGDFRGRNRGIGGEIAPNFPARPL